MNLGFDLNAGGLGRIFRNMGNMFGLGQPAYAFSGQQIERPAQTLGPLNNDAAANVMYMAARSSRRVTDAEIDKRETPGTKTVLGDKFLVTYRLTRDIKTLHKAESAYRHALRICPANNNKFKIVIIDGLLTIYQLMRAYYQSKGRKQKANADAASDRIKECEEERVKVEALVIKEQQEAKVKAAEALNDITVRTKKKVMGVFSRSEEKDEDEEEEVAEPEPTSHGSKSVIKYEAPSVKPARTIGDSAEPAVIVREVERLLQLKDGPDNYQKAWGVVSVQKHAKIVSLDELISGNMLNIKVLGKGSKFFQGLQLDIEDLSVLLKKEPVEDRTIEGRLMFRTGGILYFYFKVAGIWHKARVKGEGKGRTIVSLGTLGGKTLKMGKKDSVAIIPRITQEPKKTAGASGDVKEPAADFSFEAPLLKEAESFMVRGKMNDANRAFSGVDGISVWPDARVKALDLLAFERSDERLKGFTHQKYLKEPVMVIQKQGNQGKYVIYAVHIFKLYRGRMELDITSGKYRFYGLEELYEHFKPATRTEPGRSTTTHEGHKEEKPEKSSREKEIESALDELTRDVQISKVETALINGKNIKSALNIIAEAGYQQISDDKFLSSRAESKIEISGENKRFFWFLYQIIQNDREKHTTGEVIGDRHASDVLIFTSNKFLYMYFIVDIDGWQRVCIGKNGILVCDSIGRPVDPHGRIIEAPKVTEEVESGAEHNEDIVQTTSVSANEPADAEKQVGMEPDELNIFIDELENELIGVRDKLPWTHVYEMEAKGLLTGLPWKALLNNTLTENVALRIQDHELLVPLGLDTGKLSDLLNKQNEIDRILAFKTADQLYLYFKVKQHWYMFLVTGKEITQSKCLTANKAAEINDGGKDLPAAPAENVIKPVEVDVEWEKAFLEFMDRIHKLLSNGQGLSAGTRVNNYDDLKVLDHLRISADNVIYCIKFGVDDSKFCGVPTLIELLPARNGEAPIIFESKGITYFYFFREKEWRRICISQDGSIISRNSVKELLPSVQNGTILENAPYTLPVPEVKIETPVTPSIKAPEFIPPASPADQPTKITAEKEERVKPAKELSPEQLDAEELTDLINVVAGALQLEALNPSRNRMPWSLIKNKSKVTPLALIDVTNYPTLVAVALNDEQKKYFSDLKVNISKLDKLFRHEALDKIYAFNTGDMLCIFFKISYKWHMVQLQGETIQVLKSAEDIVGPAKPKLQPSAPLPSPKPEVKAEPDEKIIIVKPFKSYSECERYITAAERACQKVWGSPVALAGYLKELPGLHILSNDEVKKLLLMHCFEGLERTLMDAAMKRFKDGLEQEEVQRLETRAFDASFLAGFLTQKELNLPFATQLGDEMELYISHALENMNTRTRFKLRIDLKNRLITIIKMEFKLS